MNKKIALSAMSILTSLALLGGATFAFFSDVATSTGNVFGSGNLVLLLDDDNELTPAETISASFGESSMAPGDTTTGFISMHNDGSIDIAEVNLNATQDVSSSPDLATQLNITSASIGTESTCSVGVVTDVSGSFTTLADLNSDVDGVDLAGSDIATGVTKYICMTFEFDPDADDTYQGKSITETFTFLGHQDLTQ